VIRYRTDRGSRLFESLGQVWGNSTNISVNLLLGGKSHLSCSLNDTHLFNKNQILNSVFYHIDLMHGRTSLVFFSQWL